MQPPAQGHSKEVKEMTQGKLQVCVTSKPDLFFLATLHGMWDLSSLTWDQTHAPALAVSLES